MGWLCDMKDDTFFPKAAAKGSFKKSAAIKDCHQRLPKVLLKWWLSLQIVIKDCPKMAVLKDCHRRLPKVLLKWWLSSKIVIKDCLKFRWSDGCPARLSSKTAQSSAEVMAVLKDCHQRLPKVLLKWWLSLKIVIKDCLKFCWSDGCLQRLKKRLQIFD